MSENRSQLDELQQASPTSNAAAAVAFVSRLAQSSDLFGPVQLTTTPTGSMACLSNSPRALQISLLSQRLQQLLRAEAADQSAREEMFAGVYGSRQLLSRSSSVRSASRLSIVVEDSKTMANNDSSKFALFNWHEAGLNARDMRALRHLSADNLDRLLAGDWPAALVLADGQQITPHQLMQQQGSSSTAGSLTSSLHNSRVQSVTVDLGSEAKKECKGAFHRSFLHRRSHSSKVKGKCSKRQLPSIQVTEF